MKRFLILFIFLACSLLFAEEVGAVVAVYGNAIAQRQSGEEDILEKNAPIYLHDLIKVEEKSIAQIKLSDGSLLNLTSGAHYRIDQYQFKHLGEENHFFSELVQGGIRGITGSISKNNPNGVQIKTPNSVMGLRGTIFEIFIASGGTYFGCESGEVFIKNQVGQLSIGPRLPQQFGVVTGHNIQPQTLVRRPEALDLNRFMLPRGCR